MADLSFFHPEAREEFLDRVRYQHRYFPDLADQWLTTAEGIISLILDDPLRHRDASIWSPKSDP
jgi:hypothetical protein